MLFESSELVTILSAADADFRLVPIDPTNNIKTISNDIRFLCKFKATPPYQ